MESVRCLPPAFTRPRSLSAVSSRSSTFSSIPCSTNRVRNSDSTEVSNPGSSSSRPSAYFRSMPYRTRCAAARSVRFSANCNSVTSASWPGDQPGRPLVPNASANSASANNSPSSSRTRIANGTGPVPPPPAPPARSAQAPSATPSAASTFHTPLATGTPRRPLLP
ncbi:hypothetical protein SBD_2330 [Streptomyces bottropensis ATCC 25435]|uniref:Uncharacterized protein n=1 Tax=Streptomyces bottropensis ATCC 25435 TaxID=1054862 RepID=M3F416_9ACTN|nr:hypothetical protein SBD_2330 [Streptomyces bottropensis ATCC 25435]